jgi:transposase-like protein
MLPSFTSIFDLIAAFPTEQSCIDYLEYFIWKGNPVSPFDKSSKVYKCKNNRYKCVSTNKYFNVKTDTIFDNTKIPLQKWFLALYVFSSHKKGISSHQLAKDIDITQKSAWFMLHRLRNGFSHPAFKKTLKNIVEIDETFVGGEPLNKHKNKKEVRASGHAVRVKTPLLGMLERGGEVRVYKIDSIKIADIKPLILKTVEPMSIIMTDQYNGYNSINDTYFHESVNHSAKEFVRGMAHTNGIENFWSHLQRGIIGIYHWCSMEHLDAYADEFALRYNTRKSSTNDRFNVVLTNSNGRKLTYKKLTRHGKEGRGINEAAV